VEPFDVMLAGGHPNSLGRTIEVVDLILADPARLEQLYQCYFSPDEVVRLRTSNAFKRIWREHPDWLVPFFDRFLSDISQITQPSTRWTVAQMFHELNDLLTPDQRRAAVAVVQRSLTESDDWIVLNNALEALAAWAKNDPALKAWLEPHAVRLAGDARKSVAGRAARVIKALYQRQ
jgi:hypothetical protein